MSYIADDPGPRPRPRLGRGPWWAVGALLAVLVVLAAALLGVARAGVGSTDETPTLPAAPAAEDTVTWVRVADQPVPVSAAHGPRMRHGGLAAGFAHDELGAVIAAINISTRLTGSAGPDVYEPTARHQCVGDVAAAMATIAVQAGTATPGTTTPGLRRRASSSTASPAATRTATPSPSRWPPAHPRPPPRAATPHSNAPCSELFRATC